MKLVEFIQLDNLDHCLTELKHYRTIPAYQRAKTLFTDIPRSKHYDAMAQFHDFLTLHGFRRLGEGSFGAVYEKPGYPWVFKLFNNDPAYLAWLNYVLQHQDNPHVPKIKGKPFKITDKTFAVRMEKLDFASSAVDKAANLINRWKREPLKPNQLEYLDDVGIPRLAEVLDGIRDLVAKHGYNIDLHQFNIMSRGDTPVIIDPLVDSDIQRNQSNEL